MAQAKGAKMSIKTFTNSTLITRRSKKEVVIIGGVCVLVVILVAILAYLSEPPDFSLIITYLSEVRVTPAWPQIGVFPTPAP
jgi:Na+/proline symporter